MDISVASSFWLLLVQLLWKFVYKCPWMWAFISLASTQPFYTFILRWHLIVLALFLSQNYVGYSRLFAFLEKLWNQLVKLQTCLLRFWLELHGECGAFLVAGGSVVKNSFAMQEPKDVQVWSLGQEDPLEEGLAAHSSILAWRIPWTKEPGGLQSIRFQRVGHNWSDWARMHSRWECRSV